MLKTAWYQVPLGRVRRLLRAGNGAVTSRPRSVTAGSGQNPSESVKPEMLERITADPKPSPARSRGRAPNRPKADPLGVVCTRITPYFPGHIQASACCKHYAANSMEHTTEGGQTHTRHDFNANITQQDLVDSYLAGDGCRSPFPYLKSVKTELADDGRPAPTSRPF